VPPLTTLVTDAGPTVADPARTTRRTVAVLLAAASVGAVVTHAHPAAPVLVVAIGLGVAARTAGLVPDAARTGLTWTSTHVLRTGVALLGLQLALGDLGRLGVRGVLAVVATVLVTFATTLALGRVLGVPARLRLLVAAGFSICGAAAIAATTSALPAEHHRGPSGTPGAPSDERNATAAAVALVTLFGTLALVGLPLAARALHLSGQVTGLWIGLSVHEVAQVVAAAGTVSAVALAVAVVAKLARVLLLAPVVAAVGARRRTAVPPGARRPPVVPVFVAAFLALVAVRSTGVVPAPVVETAHVVSTVAMTAALTALGAQVDVRGLVHGGGRALALGASSTVVVVGVGLVGALAAAHA